VDRVAVFLSPRLLGGSRAPGSVGGTGFSLAATPRLKDTEIEAVGEDFLLTARL
jgi:riboflavin biosynthesis pyrimidine reductase